MKKFFLLFLCTVILLSACEKNNSDEKITETYVTEASVITEILQTENIAPDPNYEYCISYGNTMTIEKYLGSETKVTIPEKIEGYPVIACRPNAFADTNVAEITFPSELKTFSGIYNAHSLETINLTSDIDNINPQQIHYCENLKNFNIANSGKFISKDGVVYSADGKTLVYFPVGRTGGFTVPDGTETIGKYAFNSSGVEEVNFNDELKNIEYLAFKDTPITEFYLPDSIEKCDKFWTKNCKISAPFSAIDNDKMRQLYYFENASYRGETELQKAIRCSGEPDAWFDIKRIYLDIDGDNFPERVDIHTYDPDSVYCELSFYDPEFVEWKELPQSSSHYKIYYDDEYDEYFYIYVDGEDMLHYNKVIFTDKGFEFEYFGGELGFGYYNDENTNSYISFGTIGKDFFIIYDPDDYDKVIENAMPEYTLVKTIDLKEITAEYLSENSNGDSEIFAGEFADQPGVSEYRKPYKEKDIIASGQWRDHPMIFGQVNSSRADVYDIRDNGFDELAKMPYLKALDICNYDEFVFDLNGIEKLKGLRYLTLTGEITNAGKLSELDELTVLCINESAVADLSFLETLDSVEAVEFLSYGYPERTADGSADYYSPIYKMKNLKYLIVNSWENYITEEQIAHIHENAPWINIVYYEIG